MNRQFVPTGFSFAIVAALASALGLVVIRPAILMRAASAQQKAGVKSAARAPKDYVPVAQYCAAASPGGESQLCSIVPGNIGPDPAIDRAFGYTGLPENPPTSASEDVQTPFDNLSWQTFVALNWTRGKEKQPAEQGLKGDGPRVWEGWPRVAEIYGNGKVQADCETARPDLPVFSIASDGYGNPSPRNEEYVQAATGDPLIDVDGNWTIYERRINDIEVAYLRAPYPNHSEWNLTTLQGQKKLVDGGGTVDFPSLAPGRSTGAIEIKAAWRILDAAKHEKNKQNYYVVQAQLKVAPDLVIQKPHQKVPICKVVDMGLVAMHIIQKNPLTKNALTPQWFWSTFEHVENAPLATAACDPVRPETCDLKRPCVPNVARRSTDYSYFHLHCPRCEQNQTINKAPEPSGSAPKYAWEPNPPFAMKYLTPFTGTGTQVSRCWAVYSLTDQLNHQWREKLARAGSVFRNYMLIGTQWGGIIERSPVRRNLPQDAVPGFLSNAVIETYQQKVYVPGSFKVGSCVSCHNLARLPYRKDSKDVLSNLSFLPLLADPDLVRGRLDKMIEQFEKDAQRSP